ncbi:hypothetical protein TSUD_242250 [Trifolium subterraneum]|uniref:Uncharacterized protein n=1 Tax=Trifolium subterraneum TaxID=3900 RepID=A0A2Z6NCC0_TRISU|nr:hypothetical protein TSUD_242250 [Trifolium subterraneum]
MEPSQDIEYSEGEFSGTESGWTTYIGSPIHSEIDNDEEPSVNMDEYGNNFKNTNKKNHDDDDDDDKVEKNYDNEESDNDSMASEASSGPSHLKLVCIKSERSHDLHEHEKIQSKKRATKKLRKTKVEEPLLVADSASSHV